MEGEVPTLIKILDFKCKWPISVFVSWITLLSTKKYKNVDVTNIHPKNPKNAAIQNKIKIFFLKIWKLNADARTIVLRKI